MKNEDKTKEQLITELEEMRQRIAELQTAENGRKQAEELFRNLANSSPIAIYIVQNRKFQFVNLQFQNYAGCSENELLGKDPSIFVTPGDRDTVRENAVKMLKGEHSSPYEYKFVNKDGKVRWVMETVAPIQFQGRQGTMGNFMDITERKRMEEALRESEERYRSLVTNIPDVIWTASLQGDIIFVSPNVETVIGYTPDEMYQGGYQMLFKGIHPDDMKRITGRLGPQIKKGVPFDVEYRFQRKDGGWIWLHTRTTTAYEKDSITHVVGVSTDITERKRAEETLRQSEEKLRVMFESVAEGITVTDLKGNILEANEEIVRQMGYTKDEYIGRKGFEFVSPKDLTRATEDTIKRLTEGYIGTIEYTFIRKDGTERPAEVNASFIRDASGKPVSIVSISRDISERKRAEKALRDSEERHRSLVNNIPDVVWTATSQGNFIFMSPNIEAVAGYTPEEMYQGGYQMLLKNTHPDDVKMIVEGLGPQVEKGMPLDIEYRLRRKDKDGGWIWLHTRTTTAYEKDGTTYTDGISTDITKRKQAEEALRENEERFRLLAENAQDMIYHYRLAPTPRFEYVSPAAAAILGYTPQEYYDDPELGLKSTHPEDRPVMEAMQSSSDRWVVILRRFRKDGTIVWLEEKNVPVYDQAGNLVAVEGIARDITDRKRAEDALQELYERERELGHNLAERTRQLENAYKELYQLDKMKDGFLSTVSHELRTPLTSIKSFAEILLSYEEDKETQREFLTIINDESDRLARLINDLLDISRIESGRMQWQSTNLAIPEVIEVAIKSIYSLSAQKNISLDVDMRPDLPVFLGDRDRLVQVMTNLLGNAIKFTSEGGKIRVVAEALSANRAENKPAMIKVSVSDTGIGIAAENHKKIFNKFIQVGDTLTDKPKGTGLGLAICKEIVEHYKGTIRVESELGQGSTFIFTLPVVEETEKQVITPEKDEAKVCIEGSKLILVVDDEVNIRKFLNYELTSRGHHVLEASRGKEAIELARKYHPDLITLDIVMPDISGFDVTAVLKSDPATLDIPILIISVVEEKEKGYRLGASDYVTKPFDNKVLMDKIDVLLLGNKRKVLVVDDDESLVKAIKFELENRGYTANVAHNGEEALRAIESNCPDLVILDLIMPKIDGYEVMKRLRNKPDTANIPIVVLTGIEIDGGRVKALSLGGTEYIAKSGGLGKLFEEIENIFSKISDVQVPESPLAYK